MRLLAVVAVAVGLLDVATKHVVSRRLVEGRTYGVGGRVGLRVVRNERGARVGLDPWRAVAVWVAMAVVAAAAVETLPAIHTPVVVGLGMILGGAGGNVLDRVRHGAVVDFVVAGRWPVFNLADAAMVAGVVLGIRGAL